MATTLQQKNLPTTCDQLLRWTDVQPLVGIGRSHAHQLAQQGLFPKPLKLVPGGRASAWRLSEINQWIESRIAESNSNEAA